MTAAVAVATSEATSAFIDEVVRPNAAAMARGEGPRPAELVRSAGERGLAGLLVPEVFGGSGADHAVFATFVDAVARVCASSAVILDVHLSVGTEPIVIFGTDEQRRRHLPRIASGQVVAAFALTEADSGSDASALATRAEHDGDGYRLSGTKSFITNCGEAGVYVVMARTGPGPSGITAFLVDAELPGVSPTAPLAKMGLRGSATSQLVLDAVRVDAADRLGKEGEGFRVAMLALDSGRIGISAQACGIARGCLDDMVTAASAGGAPDETALADVAARTEASWLLTLHAARLADAGERVTRDAAVAKLYATDACVNAAIVAVEACAPDSARADHPSAIRLRDAKACQIYEGTNQVQRIVIARELLDAGSARETTAPSDDSHNRPANETAARSR